MSRITAKSSRPIEKATGSRKKGNARPGATDAPARPARAGRHRIPRHHAALTALRQRPVRLIRTTLEAWRQARDGIRKPTHDLRALMNAILHVDRTGIPCQDGSPTWSPRDLEQHPDALRDEAGGIRQAGPRTHRRFQGLSDFYQAPDAKSLFASTTPGRDAADRFGDKVATMADALRTHSAESADRPAVGAVAKPGDQAVTYFGFATEVGLGTPTHSTTAPALTLRTSSE